jgi:tRNA(adenine34) deaminase
MFTDEYFMREALKEARKAFDFDVIVCQDRIIGRGHNLTERLTDVTAHAEMQAFTAASNHLGAKYLEECTLYVTLEPCVMCAGAAFWTQIGRIVYGAADGKRGYTRTNVPLLHPRTSVAPGILENECAELLKVFFKLKRTDATE